SGAFTHPSSTLGAEALDRFEKGRDLFNRSWGDGTGRTPGQALGPLYNARSCRTCHSRDGRGHPPGSANDDAISMIVKLGLAAPKAAAGTIHAGRFGTIPLPGYGYQLQDRSVTGISAEGRVSVRYRLQPIAFAAGGLFELRAPSYRIESPAYGPLPADVRLSARVAPPMIGLGLLDAIEEADLVRLEDPRDDDGDGVSGRLNRVFSPERNRRTVGRYGWKAGVATLADQVQIAFHRDLGVSTPLFPAGADNCILAPDCLLDMADPALAGRTTELQRETVERVGFYSRHLAVPRRRSAENPDVARGERVFHDVGCADCHHPGYVTSANADPALAAQHIRPYTDLLLHDMGPDLADGFEEGEAGGREWRTAPLWGVGLTRVVSGHEYLLHDGRARGVLEAILWHGGEAATHRDRVASLDPRTLEALIAFVRSL
ncbi:MAG: thiol oxidoreductase, partial [Proteobacteria bacterium]